MRLRAPCAVIRNSKPYVLFCVTRQPPRTLPDFLNASVLSDPLHRLLGVLLFYRQVYITVRWYDATWSAFGACVPININNCAPPAWNRYTGALSCTRCAAAATALRTACWASLVRQALRLRAADPAVHFAVWALCRCTPMRGINTRAVPFRLHRI